ncbi:MAG: twin-arginine translocation signal domain-containing protein [Bacteroidales bacterium]
MEKITNSRRKFLRQLAAGTAGLGVLPHISSLMASPVFENGLSKSKVVLVKHSSVINTTGQVQQGLLQEMLNKGLTTFTGKNTLTDAWSQFFTKEEKISLKMNALGLDDLQGTDFLQHFSGVSSAITKSLSSISVEEKNILIWDRSDEELANAGFTVQREEGAMRVMGTRVARRGEPEGFNPEVFPVGKVNPSIYLLLMNVHHTSIFLC